MTIEMCQWRNMGFVRRDVKSSQRDLKFVTFSKLPMSQWLEEQTEMTWPNNDEFINHKVLPPPPLFPPFECLKVLKKIEKCLKEKRCHFEIKFLSVFCFFISQSVFIQFMSFCFCFVKTRWSESLQFSYFKRPPTHRLCVLHVIKSMKTKKL